MSRLDPRVSYYGKALYAAVWLIAFAAMWALVLGMASGCGAAARVSTSAACSALLVALGEAQHLEPERAHADLETQGAICRRLAAQPDGGAQ